MISQISCNFNWQCEAKSGYNSWHIHPGNEGGGNGAKYVLNWNSYFVGSKDRMCQLFQYYSRPDLNWQSNISYSLRLCPPYISIHVFSKTGKKRLIRGFIRKGTQSMEILRDLREIKTSSKLQTNQQCCYIT